MQINKEADFVLKGDKVIHPLVQTDGLELYYDVKGKKNSDKHKDTLLDMSGQGKDGELSGFDYDGELSGYDGDNGLVFDGIDDKLERAVLDGLSEDAFTYQLNNNVISYGEGGTVKWVKDGKVMERKGVNLVRNQESQWMSRNASVVFNSGRIVSEGDGSLAFPQVWQSFQFAEGSKYLSIVEARVLNSECSELRLSNGNYNIDTIKAVAHPTKNVWYELMGIQTVSNSARGVAVYHRYSDEKTSAGKKMEIRNAQLINLTAAFGAGNEPTLEEIQAEPDKWQWLPNPMDLLEAKELKGNILGDMEDIVDASLRDSQSGEEVFTEHADDSHVRVEVDGQSYQHAGSGKNLSNSEAFLLGNTFYGNSTSLGFSYTKSPESMAGIFPVKPNTEYTFSYSQEYETRRVALFATNEVMGEIPSRDYANRRNMVRFTTENEIIAAIAIQRKDIAPVSEEDRLNAHFQLEEGSTATEYELPAPTPDYPIEIHSLNDFDVVSSAFRRNLVIPSDVTPGHRVNSNGSISSEAGPFLTGFIEVKADEVYTITMLLQKGGYSRVAYYDLDKNFIKRDLFRNQEVTHIKPEQDGFIRWSPDVDASINDYTPGYKIELGPDHPLIDKINLSLSEPLRSVGDVKDRLFKDSDGLWKIERNVWEVVFDGTEGWDILYSRDTSAMFGLHPGNLEEPMLKSRGLVVSNMFPSIETNAKDVEGTHLGTRPRLRVRAFYERVGTTPDSTDAQKINSFKQWLSSIYTEGVPLTIVYEVESPIIETLDQELQGKLNALKSFKGSNYVYTVQNTDNPHKEQLKPTLHATFNSKDYLKETRTLTNLLIWARELSDEELIHHNQLFLNRFNLRSDRGDGEPIEQTLNLLHGGMVGHSLEQNYTINI